MRFLILLVLVGCASGPKKSADPAIRIELKGKLGMTSETRYYSNSQIKTFSDHQLLRDKQEAVEFTTLTKIKAFDPVEKLVTFTVRTTAKDGAVDLHDLAFPEKNEEIEYKVRTNGIVEKAGAYPPQSLFFVPNLPIPDGEVRVGDTWVMSHSWASARDGVPMKLEVVGILKALVPCGGASCADIEVSGGVSLLAPPTTAGARFSSRVWGRLLFHPDRGEVIWSEMRSEEEMNIGPERLAVLSCIKSATKRGVPLDCVPALAPVTLVPRDL